jgi:hypothetical protein
MFWAKRRFAYAEFAPYQDMMEKLLMANATLYREFIMVSVKAGDPGENDYYVGLPNKSLLAPFDGFQEVSEAQLPKEIDTLLVADATKEPFTSRFKFKDR